MLHQPVERFQPSSSYQDDDEIRGRAFATDLIGTDVVKGLAEVRRLEGLMADTNAVASALENKVVEACRGSAVDIDMDRYRALTKETGGYALRAAADEAVSQFFWSMIHVFELPICSLEDVRAKSALAAKYARWADDDEDFNRMVIEQIAGFFKEQDVQRAKAWIAGARECGLVVFPWASSQGSKGVMQGGVDIDGPNTFGAATKRFSAHPAWNTDDGLPKGLIFDTLCAELGVNPDDDNIAAILEAHRLNVVKEVQRAA